MKFIPELDTQSIEVDSSTIKVEDVLYKVDAWPTYEFLTQVLFSVGLLSSKGEAKRLIQQGGIRINHEKITDPECMLRVDVETKYLIQVGKRRFVNLTLTRT